MSDAPTHPPGNPAGDNTGGTASSEINTIIARFLEAAEEGNATQLLDDLCRQYPQFSERIRRRVDSLRKLGLVGPGSADSPSIPERLGDFRLLRSLGGGGMGVVYEAEQVSLGRTVALKLIRPENLFFEVSRERFRREVDAIARLQHPGIVPIYTVGEEQGIPYFAMERVRGKTLGEVLESIVPRQPWRLRGSDLLHAIASTDTTAETGHHAFFSGDWANVCIRIAREVAAALAHAHERGVLHRDVKPSNIMITPGGRVLLMDFGLAIAEGASRLTRTGARIGSLPYSPPERLAGDGRAPDARSDIYSLGVTLYELLTLQLPYYGEGADETIRRIVEGEPTPPLQLHRNLSADAATVCLKAMEVDPGHRYYSAAALERDLASLLEGRPIAARPPGAARRVYKWVQRHPASTVASVLGSVILVGGPLGYAYEQSNAKELIEKKNTELQIQTRLANEAKDAADAERKRALSDFAIATRAVDQMLTRVAEDRFRYDPGLEEFRDEVLAQAQTLWEEFLKNHASDTGVQIETAEAYRRVADIQFERGDVEKAVAACTSQIELLNKLATHDPENPQVHERLISATTARGTYWNYVQKTDAARDAFREAVARGRVAIAKFPSNQSVQAALASALDFSGVNFRDTSRFDAAIECFEESETLYRKLIAEGGGDTSTKHHLGSVLQHHGVALTQMRKPEDARKVFTESVDVLKTLAKENPDDIVIWQSLSNSQQSHANSYAMYAMPREAEPIVREALAISERLSKGYPYNSPLRQMYADQNNMLGVVCAQQSNFAQATEAFERASDEYERLARDTGMTPQLRQGIAGCNNNVGRLLLLSKDFEGARQRLEKAIETQRQSLALNPDSFQFKDFLCQQLFNLSQAWLGLKRYEDAVACAEEVGELAGKDFFKLEMAAQVWAGCYNYASTTTEVTGLDRDKEAARCLERTIHFLEESCDAGLADDRKLSSPAYQSIAGNDAFRAIVEKVKKRASEQAGKKQ
jgi:serine/threonine protein kinase/tetratricopeptide (TPR) repeat protein